MSAISVPAALRSVESSVTLYRENWKGTLASTFLGPLLYLGAIGFGLGSLVDTEGAGLGRLPDGEPVSYVAFLAVGMIAATGVQQAAGEAIWGAQERCKWRGTWKVSVNTPLMPGDLALGHMIWCGMRGLLAAFVYALVTAALGIIPLDRALLAVAPAVLSGVALAGLLSSWVVHADEDHIINAAQRFVVIPMFLFSGVFFPIQQLPGWMQPLAQATPLWHGVVLARTAALGQPTPWPLGVHLAVLAGYVVVGVLLGARVFRRRLLA